MQIDTILNLSVDQFADPTKDNFQVVFPIGVFQTDKYGEIIVTKAYIDAMVANYKNGVMGNRQPFIDINHEFGAAYGWINDLKAEADGLAAQIDWTDLGTDALTKKHFKYFSAAIGQVTKLDTGETYYPVLVATSLTNSPVMNELPAATLSENDRPVHGNGRNKIKGANHMDFPELIEALKALSESERQVVLVELGLADKIKEHGELTAKVQTLATEKEALEKVNSDLTKTLTDTQKKYHDQERETVISAGIAAGKILPKDKDFWTKQFDANPDFTSNLISGMPKVVDLTTKGSGSGGNEGDRNGGIELTEEDKEAMRLLGITDAKEYLRYLAESKE